MSLVNVSLFTATCGGAALINKNDESDTVGRIIREARQRMQSLLLALSHYTTLYYIGYCEVPGGLYRLNNLSGRRDHGDSRAHLERRPAREAESEGGGDLSQRHARGDRPTTSDI